MAKKKLDSIYMLTNLFGHSTRQNEQQKVRCL